MKRYLWIGIIVLATLGGCQSPTETPITSTETSITLTETIETPVIDENTETENVEDSIKAESYQKPKGIEKPMEFIKNVLETNNEESTIDVYFDEATGKVYVTLLTDGMLDITTLAIERDSFRTSWDDLVELYRQLTISMQQTMQEDGFSTDVVFYVLNDYNPENCLLVIQNETIIYDFVSSEK